MTLECVVPRIGLLVTGRLSAKEACCFGRLLSVAGGACLAAAILTGGLALSKNSLAPLWGDLVWLCQGRNRRCHGLHKSL
jgi:hypothetical protein